LRGGFGTHSARLANPKEFYHVQTAFSQFKSSNQTPLPLQFGSQLSLGKTGILSHSYKRLAKAFTLACKDGLFHARILRAIVACFQNASMVF
jgi:hypothetical protein